MLPLQTAKTSLHLGNSLPNEILDAIFECLSRDALARVSLVSRRWNANAERILYSTIVIHEVLPHASPAAVAAPAPAAGLEEHEQKGFFPQTTMMMMPAVPIRTLRCCETLSTRPRLAEYVRRFHLRWDTDVVECPLLLLRVAHDIAKTLVPTLVHLDSLELSFGLAAALTNAPQFPPSLETPPPPPLPAAPSHTQKPHSTPQFQQQQQRPHPHHQHLLPPICLPSLRTLALHGLGSPPPIELERILHRHPALQHLRLSDYHRALRLTPADVPSLSSFHGCPATAASILPGRPVQALGLVGGCGCELATTVEEDLARIAAGSVPVRVLDLSGMCVTPALLRSVSRHLSHVEWLKVRLALWHTLHYALSGSIVRHYIGAPPPPLLLWVLTECCLLSHRFLKIKKAAFDGAYDRPRGVLQPTRSGPLADESHGGTANCVGRGVRWAAAKRR